MTVGLIRVRVSVTVMVKSLINVYFVIFWISVSLTIGSSISETARKPPEDRTY